MSECLCFCYFLCLGCYSMQQMAYFSWRNHSKIISVKTSLYPRKNPSYFLFHQSTVLCLLPQHSPCCDLNGSSLLTHRRFWVLWWQGLCLFPLCINVPCLGKCPMHRNSSLNCYWIDCSPTLSTALDGILSNGSIRENSNVIWVII